MWQVWNALCSQHRYEENFDRYTNHIGPQLLSACLLKVRDQLCICPTTEAFRAGYQAPVVPIDDIIMRIRNGQDFRDYDVLEKWFPRPKPKQAQTPNPQPRDRNPRRQPNPPRQQQDNQPIPYEQNEGHYPQLKQFCDRFREQHRTRPRVSQLCNAAGILQAELVGPTMLQTNDCKRFHVAGSCNCGGRRTHGTLSNQKLAAIYTKLRSGMERLIANPANYIDHRHGQPAPAT